MGKNYIKNSISMNKITKLKTSSNLNMYFCLVY